MPVYDDFGEQVRVTLTTDGSTAFNVSAATSITLIMQPPNGGTPRERAMSTLNGGADGIVVYTTVDGDWDIPGRWTCSVRAVGTGYRRTSSSFAVDVRP